MTSPLLTCVLLFLLFAVTTILYCHDEQNLKGEWILDDKGTVSMNPIVNNSNNNNFLSNSYSYEGVWKKDFWGVHDVSSPQSHKSWRPLCTMSYILNRQLVAEFITKRRQKQKGEEVFMMGNAGSGSDDDDDDTIERFWFHVVDRLLHGIVTALVLPVAYYTQLHYNNDSAIMNSKNSVVYYRSFFIAIMYAVHPIHVEAVANTTGRAEVLCALFYFIAFLCYAKIGAGVNMHILNTSRNQNQYERGKEERKQSSTFVKSYIGVFLMLKFTLASMLCKEHGVTAPLMVIIWDAYIGTNTSIPELLEVVVVIMSRSGGGGKRKSTTCISSPPLDEKDAIKKKLQMDQRRRREKQCMLFLLRAILSLVGCAAMCLWRLSKNGDSRPDFVCEQNPAACEPKWHLRFIHYTFLWSFNFWLMLYPSWLSPDWSGGSITLFDDDHWATDPRFGVVLLTWFAILGVLLHSVSAASTRPHDPCYSSNEIGTDVAVHNSIKKNDYNSLHLNKTDELHRRTVLTFMYWMLLPFLMSSNLIVHVGFVVADRTLYLPSFGFCLLLMEALIFLPTYCFRIRTFMTTQTQPARLSSKVMTTVCLLILLAFYTWKQQVQTKRWSRPLLIWGEAYRLNPNSVISGTEYGMSLVNEGRNKDAAVVLREVHKKELSNRYFSHTIGSIKKDDALKDNDNEQKYKHQILEISSTSNLLRTRFKLVTAIGNSGACDKALPMILEGLGWIDDMATKLDSIEKEITNDSTDDTTENSSKSIIMSSVLSLKNANLDNKAYLLVAKSRCSGDVQGMASAAYEAVLARPQMDYVLKHAESVGSAVANIQQTGLDLHNIVTHWELENEASQTAKLSFVMKS